MFFFQFLLQAGPVLHGPAVPVRRARAQRPGDRRPAAAAVDHAAARRRRRTEAVADAPPAARGHLGPGRAAGRHRVAGRGDRARRRSRGRHGPDAAGRARRRRARLPARRRHRLRRRRTEQSGEVGGLQNTATNLGASLGTALAGSVLIGAPDRELPRGVQQNPDVPDEVADTAQVRAGRWHPVRLRRRPRARPSTRRASRRRRRRRWSTTTRPHAWPASRSAWRSWRCSPLSRCSSPGCCRRAPLAQSPRENRGRRRPRRRWRRGPRRTIAATGLSTRAVPTTYATRADVDRPQDPHRRPTTARSRGRGARRDRGWR